MLSQNPEWLYSTEMEPSLLPQARMSPCSGGAQAMLLTGFKAPAPFIFNLPGKEGYSKMKTIAELGLMQDWYPVMHPEHNTKCCIYAAEVLCGGKENTLGTEVTEQTLLDLEHEGFMKAVMEPEARDYMARILKK